MNLPVASHGVSEEAQLLRSWLLSLIFYIALNYLPVPTFAYRGNIISVRPKLSTP